MQDTGIADGALAFPCARPEVGRAAAVAALEVEEVRSRERLGACSAEWRELVARSRSATLFETEEFLSTWLDAFWRGRPLAFQLVRREGRLVGIVPLLDDDGAALWRCGALVLPANDHNGRAGILQADDERGVLAAALEQARRSHPGRRIVFKMIRSDTDLLGALGDAARALRLAFCVRRSSSSPTVDTTGSWEDYLASRASHVRSELRRKRKKLARAGVLRFECVSDERLCDAAFEDVLRIERASWKHAAGSSFTVRPLIAGFYRQLMHVAAGRGWLRLYLLRLDDQPIAHLFAVAFGGELWGLMTSYADSHRALSPGIVLADHVVREAFATEIRSFDLLGIDSRWKDELATGGRRHLNVCLSHRRDLRCQLCRFGQRYVKPLVQPLRAQLPRWQRVADARRS